MTAPERFAISFVGSKHDNHPRRELVTWEALVGHLTRPRITDCTTATCGTGIHAELDRDGKAIGCRHKNGPGWIPATFSSGRKKATVEHVSLLVVDGDHHLDDDLRAVLAKLARFRYAAHGTHSDRAGDRCARIVLPLSRSVPGVDWPRFWPAAMGSLGMPADPACCDAGRLYYLPARPRDSEFWYAVHDGETLDVATIIAGAPPSAPTIARVLDLDSGGSAGPGQRHAMLKSLAGSMRFRGATLIEIESALLLANQHRCDPPKADAAVKAIAAWAAAQPMTSLPPRTPSYDLRPDAPPPPADDDIPPPPEDWGPPPPEDWGPPHAADGEPAHAPPNDDDAPHRADQFRLETSGKRAGKPALVRHNVAIALGRLGVRLSYNLFSDQELISGLAGFGPVIDDAAINRLYLTIEERFCFRPAKDYFYDCISDICRASAFHPVRDYLDGLTWDGTPRLTTWLADFFGADDTTYTRAVARLVLVAAVRRVREPGAKFDEMLILEGEQGTEKSTGLRVLAVEPDWFGDSIELDADTRRQMEQTAGKWIVEAGELKGMSKGDRFALKAYLSRQVDEARAAYGRKTTRRPRQFIIIGTTNEDTDYLGDPTGERRYWPVKVKRANIERLRAERDQLWAEAAAAEASGESIRLDSSLWGVAAIEQEARRAGDPLVDLLREHLGEWTGKIRALDCYRLAGLEPGKTTQDQMNRIGHAMRALGWEKSKRRFGEQKTVNAYVRGTTDQRERVIEVIEECEYGRPPTFRIRPRMGVAA